MSTTQKLLWKIKNTFFYLHIQINHFINQRDIKVTVVLIISSTLGMGRERKREGRGGVKEEKKEREREKKKVDIRKHVYTNIYFPIFIFSFV